ncbi:polysaccharide deacetylase family protein [Bacillus sp. JJ1566]|uniref:polysaccharide deacetylase family protein n=1 Tax=Bacillus sp. JJ1566 TaxID=3122961 RepID=UPI0030005766
MVLAIEQLKKQYYDWRCWDYLYRKMKMNTKNQIRSTFDSYNSSIPYINKPGIAFSFDDSFRVRDWVTYGKDMFGFYDVKVTFNINAFHHYEGERKHTQDEIDMLIELQSNGHEIAHHGFRHKNVVRYTDEVGLEKWIKDEIISMFEWMEKQSHSKTGEKFTKPITFAFPYFASNEQTLKEIVPKYFKLARGFQRGYNLTPFKHSGFVPSICIDSEFLINPKNVSKILKLVKTSGCNLILTCHSILPDEVNWEIYGWPMTEHERKWRTSPRVIQYIINEAKKLGLEFYTTAELSGVATFIDRNFEKYVRNLLSKEPDEWILLSDLTSIKELDLSNQQINNLDGIQYFTSLEKLNITNSCITDSRLLEKLPNLTIRYVNEN